MADLCILLILAFFLVRLLQLYARGKPAQAGTGAREAREPDSVNPGPEVCIEPPAAEVMQRLIERTPELCTVYRKLGYAAEIDGKSGRLVHDLKALVRAHIPDFAALQRAVQDVPEQRAEPEQRAGRQDPLVEARYRMVNDVLFTAVLAAGDDDSKVLELLNRNPVDESLPFVEQVPIYKDGKVIWRTPVELSLICKRPTDPARFAQLLDETEALFKGSQLPQGNTVRQEVLDVIARVRRDLARENGYMPTSLRLLARKISECVHYAPNAATQEKREQLDHLLQELVCIRGQHLLDRARHQRLDRTDLARFRDTTQKHAKQYLDAPWMSLPWLTHAILVNLLDAELAALSEGTPDPAAASVLELIRHEVAAECYDSHETIRRLRQQEEKGLYVHSLTYPLLRLHQAPSSLPQRDKA